MFFLLTFSSTCYFIASQAYTAEQLAIYPIKPSPKTTHFHIFLWLVTSCSSTDSGWLEDDAKFGKIKCAASFSQQSLQPHGGVAIPLRCGRRHLNEWHPAQFNGVPYG